MARGQADGDAVRRQAEHTRRLLDALADVLAVSEDFSMYASLERLKKAQPLNAVAATRLAIVIQQLRTR